MARATSFGLVSGLVWALVPLFYTEHYRKHILVIGAFLVAGALAGVLISVFICIPLRWLDRPGAAAVGAMTLPLGGFLFGLFWSCLDAGLTHGTGSALSGYLGPFDPLDSAYRFAILPIYFPHTAWLVLPAIITTLLLQHRLQTSSPA